VAATSCCPAVTLARLRPPRHRALTLAPLIGGLFSLIYGVIGERSSMLG
jgi:hypothetical protein